MRLQLAWRQDRKACSLVSVVDIPSRDLAIAAVAVSFSFEPTGVVGTVKDFRMTGAIAVVVRQPLSFAAEEEPVLEGLLEPPLASYSLDYTEQQPPVVPWPMRVVRKELQLAVASRTFEPRPWHLQQLQHLVMVARQSWASLHEEKLQ